MNFKRIPSGEYYYFRREGHTEFTVLALGNEKSQGVLHLASASPKVPKELIGKKVRVKLELVK